MHALSWRFLNAPIKQLRGAGYGDALERITIDLANFEVGLKESRTSGDDYAVFNYASSLMEYFKVRGRYADRLNVALAAREAAAKLAPETIAGADNNLGNAYVDLPTGDRSENLGLAIACWVLGDPEPPRPIKPTIGPRTKGKELCPTKQPLN
jgi:hypothetical protein